MLKQKIKENWAGYAFMVLGTLLVFFLSLRPPTDPDMGWHLRHGEYIIQNDFQVAKKDVFSHSMSEFPLIMHEWVHDIMMFLLYAHGGYFWMAIFYASVTTAALIFASWGVSARAEYRIIAAILGVIAGGYVIGIRAQMFNLLGLAITAFIIFRFRKNNETKLIYYFPLLFLFWVNFHGGFAVGLFFIGLFLGIEIAKKIISYLLIKIKKFQKTKVFLQKDAVENEYLSRLFYVFIVSSLATLINPYGWRIYIEVFTTIFDSYAKSIIGEWLPVNVVNPFAFNFMTYLALLGILLAMNFRKNDYTYLLMALVFLYLAFSSWRHVPIFTIVSIPLWVSIVENMAGKELLGIINRKWFLAFFLIGVAVIAQQRSKVTPPSYNIERLSLEGNYPLGAVRYLKENTKEGNFFNEYNWGGFLIWQYPERKVYIDGRMASWKLGGRQIFREFNETMEHKPGWEKTLEDNNITQALVYSNPMNEEAFLNLGWKEVYKDGLAMVFEKP